MPVELLKNEREWDDFLESSPAGTFYHSLKWKKVLQKTFDHDALYLIIKDEDGTITGVCPGFIIRLMRLKVYDSMPYSDYGGLVARREHYERVSPLLRAFLQNSCYTKRLDCARYCFTDLKLAQFFKSPSSLSQSDRGIVEIDLKKTPPEVLWAEAFSKKFRKDIKRVERFGFSVKGAETKADLRDFYSLYFENMMHLSANPLPYEFVENMWDVLYPSNLQILFLEKQVRVGGMLSFRDKHRVYCVYTGYDRKQPVDIVNYLIWKQISKANEEGRRYVSLGSTPSDSQSHYYLQKMRFGGSFHAQDVTWNPLSVAGRILLNVRARTSFTWKIVRGFLPISLRDRF